MHHGRSFVFVYLLVLALKISIKSFLTHSLSITGLAALGGSTTVCPVHIFPPLSELLVCYQPHRQKVMPSQKSIYETFLSRHLHGIAGDVTSALLESLAEVGVRTQVQRGLALLVLDAQVRPVGSYTNKSTFTLRTQ
jgi:hypothetical protein